MGAVAPPRLARSAVAAAGGGAGRRACRARGALVARLAPLPQPGRTGPGARRQRRRPQCLDARPLETCAPFHDVEIVRWIEWAAAGSFRITFGFIVVLLVSRSPDPAH